MSPARGRAGLNSLFIVAGPIVVNDEGGGVDLESTRMVPRPRKRYERANLPAKRAELNPRVDRTIMSRTENTYFET